jgi:RNA polymerase sigma-70 factor, ECF subfamily
LEQLLLNTKVLNKQSQIEQIYRDYKEAVYNYIYRLSNDTNQAQDVVQHTFLKLMTDPGLSDVENIKSYLFTIARNHLYDTWKKKKETLVDDAGIDIAASADDAELSEELTRQQRQQAVVFCVQRLTDKFRELMILRYMQDLSIQEIASITQLSQSDIKVSLLRARQQFDRGLTQHMYLKVAKSRQQCTEMNSMLAPYKDADIPETELLAFEKHIDKCSVCAEDAEELKRTRKLLALIPLASVPLSLDTSLNDAMAASSSPSTPVPDASTAGNAVLVKVAVTVAIGALIVGGVLLLPDKQPVNAPVDTPNDVQQSPPPSPQPSKQSQASTQTTPTGSVAVTATARLKTGAPSVKVLWGVYKLSQDKKTQAQHVGGANGETLNKELDPGQYRITAQIDQLRLERDIEVAAGQPQSLDFVFNVSEVRVSTQLASTINLYDSHLMYIIYKSREDMEAGKNITVKQFRKPASIFKLAAGDYFLKAIYRGFGNNEVVKRFTVKDGNPVNIDIPVEVGMFKPEATLSNNSLPHIRNISWAIKKASVPVNQPAGFVTIRNGTETPMMPGTYTLEAKLEHITQLSEVTIKAGQVTTYKVILKGGIVNFAGWLDKSKTKRNDDIYFYLYDYDTYKSISNKNDYIPRIAQLNNDSNNSQILAEGKYTIVAHNKLGHKLRLTHDFTVNDGDTKQVDVVVKK